MPSFVTRLALVSLAAACAVFVPRTAAFADTTCQQTDPATGNCVLWVEVRNPDPKAPQDDGPRDSGAGQACYWDPDKQGVRTPPAGPVPCTSDAGYWSNAYNCYVQLARPQPPSGDPGWSGHRPGDGAVYFCFQPQTGLLVTFWASNAPAGSGAGPSPRDVAQIAVENMALSAVNIGIAPEAGPDSVGLVGMPVWMWAKDPDRHTYGPVTATASAGGITIRATAEVVRVTWDMGDGTKVVCTSPGTPYRPSYGRKQSPDCGHTYTRSSVHERGRRYTVSATSDWVVRWAGAGQSGTIRLDGLVRSTQVTIGEAQVLVR